MNMRYLLEHEQRFQYCTNALQATDVISQRKKPSRNMTEARLHYSANQKLRNYKNEALVLPNETCTASSSHAKRGTYDKVIF